jgi:M6 family metalloprotease-like protein
MSQPLSPTGTLRALVVPCRFTNHATRTLPQREVYEKIFNHHGVGRDYPGGSVTDYFLVQSAGKLDLKFTITDWLNLPFDEKTARNHGDVMAQRAFSHAVAGGIDLSVLDSNADGFIDILILLHSGYSAAYQTPDVDGVPASERLWSHRSYMESWLEPRSAIRVDNYLLISALNWTGGGQPTQIGIVCHELAHMLGLKDQYHEGSTHPGCLMRTSGGNYPPPLCPVCKAELGWLAAPPAPVPVPPLPMPAPWTEADIAKLANLAFGYCKGAAPDNDAMLAALFPFKGLLK